MDNSKLYELIAEMSNNIFNTEDPKTRNIYRKFYAKLVSLLSNEGMVPKNAVPFHCTAELIHKLSKEDGEIEVAKYMKIQEKINEPKSV